MRNRACSFICLIGLVAVLAAVALRAFAGDGAPPRQFALEDLVAVGALLEQRIGREAPEVKQLREATDLLIAIHGSAVGDRYEAIRRLGDSGRPDLVALCFVRAESTVAEPMERDGVQWRCVEALGKSRDARAVAYCVYVLEEKPYWIRTLDSEIVTARVLIRRAARSAIVSLLADEGDRSNLLADGEAGTPKVVSIAKARLAANSSLQAGFGGAASPPALKKE